MIGKAAIAVISAFLCFSISIACIGLVLIGRTVFVWQLFRELRDPKGIAVRVRFVADLEGLQERAPEELEESDTIKGNNYH